MGVGVRALVALIAGLLAATGCKGSEKNAEAAQQVIAQSDDIAKEEDSLLARRDALVKARQRIRDERDALDERRRAALAAGEDTSEIDSQVEQLIEEESGLLDEEEALNRRYKQIIQQRREMVDVLATSGGGDQGAAVAAREKSIAARERDLAQREKELAAREATLAEREANMCGGVAPEPTTIIKTVDVKGSSYTKKDVEPLLARARRYMSRKGLRRSDLPEPVQDLDKEATKAMEDGDYGRARFAASQLVRTVRSIRVNKSFIQAKIGRLNDRIRGKDLGAAEQKQVDKLFRDATEDYGDGKFARANRKLNKIYALID